MSRHIGDVDAADHVGLRRQQWRKELPKVDTRGMAILGRARWITLLVRPAIEGVFDKHGVDSGEFDVLSTLLRSGAPYRLRPTELFRSLMISSGGLTDRLARLESSGLIARAIDPEDARSRTVELTPKGRELADAAFHEDMAVEAQLISVLSTPDQEMLALLLAKLAAGLASLSQ